MLRRNRGNFPSKGKSGTCRIQGCRQMGKMFKRLDNHLSRCHKGVTRGMNDQQAWKESRILRVTCLLPGCFKEVLHFHRHLKNKHSMSVNEYKEKVSKVEQGRKQQASAEINENKNGRENDQTRYALVEKDERVVYAEDSDISEAENVLPESVVDEQLQLTKDESQSQEGEEEQNNIHLHTELNGYSDDRLRYLVHNTSPDGVRFMLAAMRSGTSLQQFQKSKLCRVMFGVMPFSTLQDIYIHRKYLTSFYRLGKYYPYPDKSMISHCLACDAKERGSCGCPTLPKSFYIYCKQQCSSDWNCRKCVNFNCVKSHLCFDFFECKRCDEEYRVSSRYQPYP